MKSVGIPKFTEKDIHGIAGSQSIIGRGRQYYHGGAIRSIKIEEDTVIAKVQGTRLYTTTIHFDDGVDGECSCPYSYGCKHIVAVLYKLLREHTPSTTSQQKFKRQNERKQPAWISLDLALGFANSLPKETACRAFDIANKNADRTLVFNYNNFTIRLDDFGPCNVTVQKGQSWMRRNFSGSCERCEIEQYYGKPCEHIFAAVLVSLKNQGTSFESHEKKIRQAYEKECYGQLVSCLEAPDIGAKQNSPYKFFFSFELAESISLCLQQGFCSLPMMCSNIYASMSFPILLNSIIQMHSGRKLRR